MIITNEQLKAIAATATTTTVRVIATELLARRERDARIASCDTCVDIQTHELREPCRECFGGIGNHWQDALLVEKGEVKG